MRTPDLPAGARRNGLAVIAALTVAALAVGVAAISLPPGSGQDDGDGPAASMTSSSTPSGDASVLEIDHGPSDDEAAVADCAGSDFADAGDVEVVYDVVQEAPGGTTPVLVLRNADGDLRLCDMTGPDAPASLPLPQADTSEPVVELTNSDRIWNCDGTVLAGFRATTWLSTGPDVAEVAQRFVVDGTAGPWFSTTPVAGVAHLQVWLGPQNEDAEIHLEQRAATSDGTPVETRWDADQRVAGCTGTGGDVQIG